jgi:hypothetical protein
MVLGGCGDGGNGPSGTGLADIELRVPAGVTDGIVLVVITGGTVKTVQSAGPQFRAVGENTPTAQVVARGVFAGPAAKLATICVDQIQNLSHFQTAVIQVAGGQSDGYAVRDIAGYTATLANPRTVSSCS